MKNIILYIVLCKVNRCQFIFELDDIFLYINYCNVIRYNKILLLIYIKNYFCIYVFLNFYFEKLHKLLKTIPCI